MKTIKFKHCFGLIFCIFFVFFYSSAGAQSSEKENFCFTCHTNAPKLIKLTRLIAKSKIGKPGGSAITEGEG